MDLFLVLGLSWAGLGFAFWAGCCLADKAGWKREERWTVAEILEREG